MVCVPFVVFLGSGKLVHHLSELYCDKISTKLYYEDFKGLPPIQTALRLLPMTVTGIACNVLIALLIGRVDLVIIICT